MAAVVAVKRAHAVGLWTASVRAQGCNKVVAITAYHSLVTGTYHRPQSFSGLDLSQIICGAMSAESRGGAKALPVAEVWQVDVPKQHGGRQESCARIGDALTSNIPAHMPGALQAAHSSFGGCLQKLLVSSCCTGREADTADQHVKMLQLLGSGSQPCVGHGRGVQVQVKGSFEVPHVRACRDVEGGPAVEIIMPHHSRQHDSLYLLKDGYIFANVCTRDNSCAAQRDCEHERDKPGRFWWQHQSLQCLGAAWQAVCSIL